MGFGGAAALLALQAFGLPSGPGDTRVDALVCCATIIGPIEDGLKWLAVAWVAYRSREFDEPVDALVYASVAAIGFAAVESLLLARCASEADLLARAVAAPVTHDAFRVALGLRALVRSRFGARSRRRAIVWMITALIAASLAHGLYDFALLAGGDTRSSALIALGLWVYQLSQYHRLSQNRTGSKLDPDSPARGCLGPSRVRLTGGPAAAPTTRSTAVVPDWLKDE